MEGLNNLSLDNEMLVALYSHSLVDLKAKCVVVVTKSKLTGNQHEFLMQILNACRLESADVTVINVSDKKTVLERVISETSPQYILSFGTGDGTELFTMGNNEGRKYLNAPALEELMHETDSSKLLKRKTWNELKLLFGI
jgi:hypothetical protein